MSKVLALLGALHVDTAPRLAHVLASHGFHELGVAVLEEYGPSEVAAPEVPALALREQRGEPQGPSALQLQAFVQEAVQRAVAQALSSVPAAQLAQATSSGTAPTV